MEFRFNVTGTDRKALVKAMGNILQVKPKSWNADSSL